ncbi:PaaI family thioesterase [Ornithinimicrobium sp. LYQ92]|uniref:PaaI family thioesterase n=1 Tax=Serinicoccus sp. LYQ92 TaxID=3378798 RepID=UPI003851F95F
MTDTPHPASPQPDVARGDLAERMGMQLMEVSAQRTVATMPVRGNTQPYGLLHGGASAALAETVASVAAATHAGPGRIAVGIDLNATHHRAVRTGTVTAVATPLSLGRSVASYEVVVTDDDGERVCTARLTCAVRDQPPAR